MLLIFNLTLGSHNSCSMDFFTCEVAMKRGAKVGIGSDLGDEVFVTGLQSVVHLGLGVEAARL
jgi:hypothetical protein